MKPGFRDTVFRQLFNNEEAAKQLINAIDGTNYGDDARVQMYNLENSIFTQMANDLSFSIEDRLFVLVEHQSTINPNMPYRMVRYFAEAMGELFSDVNFYGSSLKKIYRPEFYVLYNGKDEIPEESIIKLSDMYLCEGYDFLEAKVKVIDIRRGTGHEILKRCSLLEEYSKFEEIATDEITRNGKSLITTERILKRCEEGNILSDYLREHGGGAVRMAYEKFDWDEYAEQLQKDSWEEQYAEIVERLKAQGYSDEEIKNLIGECKAVG